MRFRTFFIVLLFILLGLLLWSAGLYTDYLWFNHLNYASVFFTVFLSEWAVRLAACLVFSSSLSISCSCAVYIKCAQPGVKGGLWNRPRQDVNSTENYPFFLVSSLAVSFLLSSYTGGLWLEVQQFSAGPGLG